MSHIYYTTGEIGEIVDILYILNDAGAEVNEDDQYNILDQNLNTTLEIDTPAWNQGVDIIVEASINIPIHGIGMWIGNGDVHNFELQTRISLYGSDDLTVEEADPQHADNWEVVGFYSGNADHGYGKDRDRFFYHHVASTTSVVANKYDQDDDGYWYLKYKYYKVRIFYGADETVNIDLSQIYFLRKHTITRTHQLGGSYLREIYDNSATKLSGDRERISRNYINPITEIGREYRLVGTSQATVYDNIYNRSRGRAYPLFYQPGTEPEDGYLIRLDSDKPNRKPIDYGLEKGQINFKTEPFGD